MSVLYLNIIYGLRTNGMWNVIKYNKDGDEES